MKIETELNATDRALLAEAVDGFVPPRVIDIHAHIVEPSGYHPTTLGPHLNGKTITPANFRSAVDLLLPGGRLQGGLVFPFPARDHDRPAINDWMYARLADDYGAFCMRGLAIVGPRDHPARAEAAMAEGRCVGLKSYHFYAKPGDTSQVSIEDFTPEWMWALCDRHSGILMLHIMRDAAILEPGNQETLRRLGSKYPRCQVVLAHIGRSFNQRTARGLSAVADLPNMWVDTSAVTETETFRTALDILGPDRVLFGTDYPVSHLRGRCVTTGNQFHWIYAEDNQPNAMTLVGIEELLALRAACEQAGLKQADVEKIFAGNAERLLGLYLR